MVEEIASNITRKKPEQVADLCSMVYEALMRYDSQKIGQMCADGSIRFFIARIISNNIRKNGRYYHIFTDYERRSEQIDGAKYYGKEDPPY